MDQFAASSVLDALVHYTANADDLTNLFDVCKSFRIIGRMIIDTILRECPYKAPLWLKLLNRNHECINVTFRICPAERPALEVEMWCDTAHKNVLIHEETLDESHDDTYLYNHIPTCPCSLEKNLGYKCECEDESDGNDSEYDNWDESEYDHGCDLVRDHSDD